MEHLPFLHDLVVILTTSIVVILLCNRIRIPSVVGLLITGAIIGPFGFGLVRDVEQVRVLAEIGVIALLFTIGLEFSLERLRQVKRNLFLGGGLQALITIGVVTPIVIAIGFGTPRAVWFSFLVTLSSTAIVLKLYGERKELETPHGRLILGILLFQDFLVVPMMIVTPVLAGTVQMSPLTIAVRFGGGVLIIAVVVVVARYLMPRLLAILVRSKSRDVFVLGTLLAALGMAAITNALEFSMALGAFLAGIIISESEFSHQVVADVLPFRDVFNSLFFISIGMLLDSGFVLERIFLVLGTGVAVLVLKAAIIFAIIRIMKFPSRTAAISSLSLCQVGEFSFVLANVGVGTPLLTDELYTGFIAASIVTMLITPFLIEMAPRISTWIQNRFGGSGRHHEDTVSEAIENHVIIVGFGLNGRNLARVLREVGIPYVALDLSGDLIAREREAGHTMIFGDATRRELLEEAGIERASTIVFGISDLMAVQKAVPFARQLNPDIRIIVRTRQVDEIEKLYQLGADVVIAEEFETSIEIFTRVLDGYHVPRNVVEAQTRVLRAEGYEMMRSPMRGVVSEKVLDALAAGATDTFLVPRDSPAVGHSLAELDLRARTGASIIAVVRGQEAFTNPDADLAIDAGDFLVLIGSHASLDQAFGMLAAPAAAAPRSSN